MQRTPSIFFLTTIFLAIFFATGCKDQSPQCVTMRECCSLLHGNPGVGRSCDPQVLSHVDKPETCLAVLQSVDAMFESKGRKTPPVCKLPAK